MAKWRVKDGTQAKYDGKLYGPGGTFTASAGQVRAAGLEPYVEAVPEKKAESRSDSKAQQSSANKAVQSSSNKSEAKDK